MAPRSRRSPCRLRRLALALAAALALTAGSSATANANPLAPFIDLQEQGLTQVDDAIGLEGGLATPRSLTVNVGGTVRFALLYWAGRDRPCPPNGSGGCTLTQPYKDQQLVFNGTPLTGTLIGQEAQPATDGGATNNIGYFADVTSLVSAAGTGQKTFSLADGNASSNLFRLDGATLFVAYTDPASTVTYRMLVWDNLDFAFGDDLTPGETRVMSPVTFAHGAKPFARQAKLTVGVGDATAEQPDRLTIDNNAPIDRCLNGSAGPRWDTDSFPVSIPADVDHTAVQVLSEPAGQNPDSLLWEFATLVVPVDAASVATQDESVGCVAPPSPPPPDPGPAPDVLKPQISGLALTPRKFRAARSGPGLAAVVGSTLRFSLSEAAAVNFRVQRAVKGRKVGRRCVRARRSNRRRPACTRYVTLRGRLPYQANQGANSVRFRGRLRGRRLKAGRYRLLAGAVDSAGNHSDVARARFRIVR